MQFFRNNAGSALAYSASSFDSYLYINPSDSPLFPNFDAVYTYQPSSNANRWGDYFVVSLSAEPCNPDTDREIVYVFEHTGDGLLNGCLRGQEGTVARDWAAGTYVEMVLTAGSLQNLSKVVTKKEYAVVSSFDSTNPSVVTTYPRTASYHKVSMIDNHSLLLDREGKLYSVGDNTYGQLGLGDVVNRSTPTQVGSDEDWVDIYAGSNMSFAIKEGGNLYCWGSNAYSIIGSSNTSSPVLYGTDWGMFSCGLTHVAGIKRDNTLWAWGLNSDGQIGDNTFSNKVTPKQIGGAEWRQVSCGGSYTLAIKTDGTLWGWGKNDKYQLGLGDVTSRFIPTKIGTGTAWRYAAAGYEHSGAIGSYTSGDITTTNQLFMWGDNTYGQLGLGDNESRSTPSFVRIDSGSSINTGFLSSSDIRIKKVVCGMKKTAAITFDDYCYMWGNSSV